MARRKKVQLSITAIPPIDAIIPAMKADFLAIALEEVLFNLLIIIFRQQNNFTN